MAFHPGTTASGVEILAPALELPALTHSMPAPARLSLPELDFRLGDACVQRTDSYAADVTHAAIRQQSLSCSRSAVCLLKRNGAAPSRSEQTSRIFIQSKHQLRGSLVGMGRSPLGTGGSHSRNTHSALRYSTCAEIRASVMFADTAAEQWQAGCLQLTLRPLLMTARPLAVSADCHAESVDGVVCLYGAFLQASVPSAGIRPCGCLLWQPDRCTMLPCRLLHMADADTGNGRWKLPPAPSQSPERDRQHSNGCSRMAVIQGAPYSRAGRSVFPSRDRPLYAATFRAWQSIYSPH